MGVDRRSSSSCRSGRRTLGMLLLCREDADGRCNVSSCSRDATGWGQKQLDGQASAAQQCSAVLHSRSVSFNNCIHSCSRLHRLKRQAYSFGCCCTCELHCLNSSRCVLLCCSMCAEPSVWSGAADCWLGQRRASAVSASSSQQGSRAAQQCCCPMPAFTGPWSA